MKKKNKVYSSKSAIILCLFVFISLIIFTIIEIYALTQASSNHENIGHIIILVCYLSLIIPIIFVANRSCCVVFYDSETNTIYRKGLFCGYKYSVSIENIKEIIIVSQVKEGVFYIFVDSCNTRYDALYKKSFIRIEKNEKNEKFIKQFWNKPIKYIGDLEKCLTKK